MIGAEGTTPLDPDEAEGLLPSHITTQAELNAWEQLNISRAERWVFSRRRRSVAVVLSPSFAEEMHRRMFDATWSWAGVYRRSGKNIGVSASTVRVALHDRLADVAVWRGTESYGVDEIAARLHYQLVLIHPWPNGNGRWARLMADALLHADGQPRFSWGREQLMRPTTARANYLAALKAADKGDFRPMLRFVRS